MLLQFLSFFYFLFPPELSLISAFLSFSLFLCLLSLFPLFLRLGFFLLLPCEAAASITYSHTHTYGTATHMHATQPGHTHVSHACTLLVGQPCTSSTCMVTHVTMCPPCTPLGGCHMSLMRAATCPPCTHMHASLCVYHVSSTCCIAMLFFFAVQKKKKTCCIAMLCFTPNCEVIQIYNFTAKKY